MNQLDSFKDFSLKKTHSNEENNKNNESIDQQEKVLCNHCGRTSANGIRCMGICVADNEY
tara:strand:+ start:1054 stop:1233 length:180 start_codon:yes stop_codon:yes gene_type:complete